MNLSALKQGLGKAHVAFHHMNSVRVVFVPCYRWSVSLQLFPVMRIFLRLLGVIITTNGSLRGSKNYFKDRCIIISQPTFQISTSFISFKKEMPILSQVCKPDHFELQNSLTNDLNGFRSRINRHSSSLRFFKSAFLNDLHLLFFFSCNFKPCTGFSALRGMNRS